MEATGKKKKKDESTVRKGTWKAEEDQVLIKHVEKYGPREWSSIRSKGLLQRTGKSCRLRWVNKLQPNLKTGCKFTEEEERVVIELQSRFGNKWAKIATYLTGRTDNDVKNFWSSRQKRLARILRTTSAAATAASCSSSSNHNPKPSRKPPTSSTKRVSSPASAYGNLISLPEAPMLRSSMEEETPVETADLMVKPAAESCSLLPKSEAGEEVAVIPPLKLEPVVISQTEAISFPEMKAEPEDFIAFSPESEEILAGLGDNPFLFFDVFGSAGDGDTMIPDHHQLGDAAPRELLDPSGKVPEAGGGVNDINAITGAGGFDDVHNGEDEDFPDDYVFDKLDDLPSPSKW